MTHYDVFNGDADGICALHQLRLDAPRDSVLVTGTKRENALLGRIDVRAGDSVTALDIALPGNRDALLRMLALGVPVLYVDHHEPGDVPAHPLLDALIDTAADVCTSALVDRRLGGRHRRWAAVAAFGDNLPDTGSRLAAALAAPADAVDRWRELGECINYNAYGLTEDDLVYRPAELYRALAGYADPTRFIEREPHFETLRTTRNEDLERARACARREIGPMARLHLLPDAAWARRISGSYANTVLNAEPTRAHVIAMQRPRADDAASAGASYLVSLRLPAGSPASAHELCKSFGGGGRRGAAGIDALPEADLERFARSVGAALGG